MNGIKKISIAALLLAAALFQTDSFAKRGAVAQAPVIVAAADVAVEVDAVINAETDQVNQMRIETAAIKDEAATAINNAQRQLEQGKISRVQLAKVVGEQNYNIQQAEAKLAQVIEQSVQAVKEAEAQEGYLSRLVSGAKVWYYGPEEERAVAQAIIDQLQKDLRKTEEEYEQKMKKARGRNKKSLGKELDMIRQEFADEIYAQQQTTGGRTSSKKFWGAVGLAGAAIGGALAYKYLGGETLPTEAWLNEAMKKQEQLQIENELLDAAMARQRELEALAETPTLLERIREGTRNAGQTITNVAQQTQPGITNAARQAQEAMEQARRQFPFSAEKQIELGEGKVEQLRADIARKQAEVQEAEQKRAALKAERERVDAEIAQRNEAKRLKKLTPAQIKKETEKTPEQRKKEEYAASGPLGYLNKRAENKQAAAERKKIESQLAVKEDFIQRLEKSKPETERWAAEQHKKLEALQAEKAGLTGSALTRKSRAIINQKIAVDKADKGLRYITTELDNANATAEQLRQKLGK